MDYWDALDLVSIMSRTIIDLRDYPAILNFGQMHANRVFLRGVWWTIAGLDLKRSEISLGPAQQRVANQVLKRGRRTMYLPIVLAVTLGYTRDSPFGTTIGMFKPGPDVGQYRWGYPSEEEAIAGFLGSGLEEFVRAWLDDEEAEEFVRQMRGGEPRPGEFIAFHHRFDADDHPGLQPHQLAVIVENELMDRIYEEIRRAYPNEFLLAEIIA